MDIFASVDSTLNLFVKQKCTGLESDVIVDLKTILIGWQNVHSFMQLKPKCAPLAWSLRAQIPLTKDIRCMVW